MGELRSNHFHAGLDIKTGGRTGLPVYAAESGYIMRVKIQEGGYGNVLYVYHPTTKHTTVYAHLKKFSPKIAAYVRAKQYEKESFTIELFPNKTDFPVTRGDIIAYSGNTGGSGGPHLHFEIRNKDQHLLNPLDFKFKEIKDNIAPSIYELLITTKSIDSRVNNEFGKIPFTPRKTNGNNHVIDKTIAANGTISFAIKTNDRLNGSSNKNGTNYIKLFVDDVLMFQYLNNKFSFGKTRYINSHFDFELADNGNGRFHNLFIHDGNALPLYPVAVNNGLINITDNKKHDIKIICTDALGNNSYLNFSIQGNQSPKKMVNHYAKLSAPYTTAIIENTLKITTKAKQSTIRIDNREYTPDYNLNNASIFLYDLKKVTPDSITIENQTYPLHFIKKVIPTEKSHIYSSTADFHIARNAFYDTTYFQYHATNDTFYIHHSTTPLQRYINITLKVDTGNFKEKTDVYSMGSDGTIYYEGGNWGSNGIHFRTRSLGRYFLQTDTIPPKIRYSHKSNGEVHLKITDLMSGIKTYNAYLNNKWLLMHYDYKRNLIWSERLNKTIELKGLLKVIVTDNAGNEQTLEVNL